MTHPITLYPEAVKQVADVTVTVLAAVHNVIAPAVFACVSCACLFWPDKTGDGFMVDRYAHTGGSKPGECDQPCVCHNLPAEVRWTGVAWVAVDG